MNIQTRFENKQFINLLYFMGYRYPGMSLQRYIETTRSEENTQNVIIDNKVLIRDKKLFIHMSRIFYCFIILSLTLLEPLYIWYQIFTIPNSVYKVTYASFSIIPSISYIIGITYFNTKHFDDKMAEIRGSTLTYFNQESKILCFTFTLLAISSIFSAMITYIDLFIVYTGMQFTELLDNIPGVFIICMQIGSWLYGRIALILNIAVFLTVFTSHIKELDNCVTIMKNRNSFEGDWYVNISDICYEILKIKGGLEVSIKYLQPMYTVPTMLGTVGIGAFINIALYDTPNTFTIISVIIYMVIQLFILFIMYFVNEQKEIIKKIIQSPRFTYSFLQNIRQVYRQDKYRVLSTSMTYQQTVEQYCKVTNASVDWIILNTILVEEWETFQIFGMTFNDGQAIQKAFSFSALLVSMNFIAENSL